MPVFASAYKNLKRFAQRRKLALTALFACAGILLALFIDLHALVFLALGAAAALGSVLFYKEKRAVCICLLLTAVLFLFSGYTAFRDIRPEISLSKKGDVTGVVSKKPQYQPDKNRTVLHLDDVTIDSEPFSYKIYVYIYGNNEENLYEYGQTLTMCGAGLWIPDGRTNPNGFDFASYLWRRGIAACASSSVFKVQIQGESPSLKRALYRFSDSLSARFDDIFASCAGIMRALLLGDQSGLGDETYESFQEAGVAHLVALSGLHVGCIAMFFETLFMVFMIPSRVRGVLTVVLIGLYTVMTGASASLMRAAMMYGFLVLSRFSGQPSDLLTRLSGAFLIQAIINPLAIQDTGMQLSYLSVLSIALMTNPVKSLFPLIKTRRAPEESILLTVYNDGVSAFSASCAVQLGTLPSMASLFYSVPVLSVPVNLFVVPLGLITVYAGASAVILSFASSALAGLVARPVEWVWLLITRLTEFVSGIPFATMNARAWSAWAVGIYCILMAGASPYISEKRRTSAALSLAAAAFAMVMLFLPAPAHTGLDIVFLDAGYADSSVVFADNSAYVYDCGKDNEITADYLTSVGADVKGVFISHPDIDHAGGADEILKRYPDACVYVSECWNRMDVRESVRDAVYGREIVYLSAGDRVLLSEEMTAAVVWPPEGFEPKEDNDGSLVLQIVYGEASALLTGDITERVDDNLTVDTDVLKVAHHGSKKATSEEMLAHATPEIAVISVSSNGHGHPTEEVLKRLEDVNARVFRTDECGAITVSMRKDGTYHIKTYLPAGGNREK